VASSDTPFRTAWLLVHDNVFARENASAPLAVWPRGSLRYILEVAKETWFEYGVKLTIGAIDIITDTDAARLRRNNTDKASVLQAASDLASFSVPDTDLPIARTACRNWLEVKVMRTATELASKAMDKGDMDKAKALLAAAELAPGDNGQAERLNAKSSNPFASTLTLSADAIPTGLFDLDQVWRGGARPGDLGMIVAPTGMGKSMFLAKLAASAFWAGKQVLYDTHELSPQQIKARFLGATLELGKSGIATTTWTDALIRQGKMLGIDPANTGDFEVRNDFATWGDLTGGLERYKDEHGQYPDILLLDSADDIAPMNKTAKAWESLREAYVYLRQLAAAKQMVIWSTGQLNRESISMAVKSQGNTHASLRVIGDSFAKAQKSHYVLALSQTDNQRNNISGPKLSMHVLKDSLHGSTGSVLEVDAGYGQGDNGYASFAIEKIYNLPTIT
jgi:hypothetical protein